MSDAERIAELERKVALLRPFALRVVGNRFAIWSDQDDALAALAEPPDPKAWRPWGSFKTTDGALLWWRDPDSGETHVDAALIDKDGVIVGKGACGLLDYSLCQACRIPDDVLAAIANRGDFP